MGQRVDRVDTPASEEDLAKAIINAWQKNFGQVPYKEQVAILLAQISLETAQGKAIHNYNVGNITTSGKDSDYFDDLTTKEQVSPGKFEKKNLKYRAYLNLNDGVAQYINLISNPTGRYKDAWDHVLSPDPVAYSKALKQMGYYTANEAPYTKGLTSLFDRYKKSDLIKVQEIENKIKKLKDIKQKGSKLKEKDVKKIDDLIKKIRSELPTESSSSLADSSEPKLSELSNSDFLNELNQTIDIYSNAATKISILKLAQLPQNIFKLQIESNDITDSIEFSNILCYALDEKLSSKSFIHTNGQNVEIECKIAGPLNTCYNAIKEITEVVSDSFSTATKKIGSVKVFANITTNKSSYPAITVEAYESNHRKFLLKFV